MAVRFILFLVLLVIGLVLFGVRRATQRSTSSFVLPLAVPLTFMVVAAVLLLFSFTAIVQTRDIGIVTSFGRPIRNLDNGLHPKLPWQKVSTLDGAIQTDSYTGTGGCTDIRIGNESTACVDNSIRWRIKPDAGDVLFRDYHTMHTIRDSLVTRELKASLNDALSDYNPLDQIQANDAGAKPNLNEFAASVTESMQSEIGDQIEVLNVIIPIIRFDDSTQQKINAYQAEVANTRIAEQREKTASAQAAANRNLSKSVSQDPNVLVSKCFDTLDEMVRNHVAVPAGFSCWPNGGSALVVPSGGR